MKNSISLIILQFVFSVALYAQTDIVNDLDFSHCGYGSNEKPVPFVESVFMVDPPEGDATELIQQAIDRVSARKPDKNGFRGAVLLNHGNFSIAGNIRISTSGIVLRGSENTVLIAAGNKRRTLIEVRGADVSNQATKVFKIDEAFVKPGAEKLRLENTGDLKSGDDIFIIRPCTKKWIEELKMDRFYGLFEWRLNWAEGTRELKWDRRITGIEDNTIFFNGPVTTELDTLFARAYVQAYRWPGRISKVGIENLKCISEHASSNPKDEEHSWICVNISNAENCWVKNLEAFHFAGSALMLQATTKQITVENCTYADPVSEIGGLRRISFYNGGQLNLIRNCTSKNGRHDFVAGYCSAGPNVFKDCVAEEALHFSGSHESWACGALFDNVSIVGNDIRLGNIEYYSQGAGYSASNCVVWNCNASNIQVDDPPHSVNYIYGSVGTLTGNSEPHTPHKNYKIPSLFDHQLEKRIGTERFTLLKNGIAQAEEKPVSFVFDDSKRPPEEKTKNQSIEIINGRFVCNGKIFWSGHEGTEVWKGSLVSGRPNSASRCLTRFVPGREYKHMPDNLPVLADILVKEDRCMLEQRPGLWYDRRRADHQIVARKEGDVWGPFLEMPWARSGEGTAWDGLSKYDLTRFNPWYFERIREFADLCDQKRLLMYNEIYNNHNSIENASHWVDFPWRPVNNIQETGFTEPPPFEYGKHSNYHYEIAIADEFYDVSHPGNRKLHELYIHKYLETLKDNQNVLHTIGYQFSGSLEFARFFFNTVIQWQNENEIRLKWALQTGKNLTDSILSDDKYREIIDVIDTRYWQYLEDGELYAPPAGKNKAFRQFRKRFPDSRRPPSTEHLLYKQVREYRDAFPEKAIISYTAGAGPLPILMAGGSYALFQYDHLTTSPKNYPFNDFVNRYLAEILWQMYPLDDISPSPEDTWCLAKPGSAYLIYSLSGEKIEARLEKGEYNYRWFSPEGKALSEYTSISVKELESFNPPGQKPALLYISR